MKPGYKEVSSKTEIEVRANNVEIEDTESVNSIESSRNAEFEGNTEKQIAFFSRPKKCNVILILY